MNYTQNYQLPQWESSDRILMEDFNEAMEKIEGGLSEKIGITFGTYTGNGAASQDIALAAAPKAVMVWPRDTANQPTDRRGCIGLAAQGLSATFYSQDTVQLTASGFRVFYYDDGYGTLMTNGISTVYMYLAIF